MTPTNDTPAPREPRAAYQPPPLNCQHGRPTAICAICAPAAEADYAVWAALQDSPAPREPTDAEWWTRALACPLKCAVVGYCAKATCAAPHVVGGEPPATNYVQVIPGTFRPLDDDGKPFDCAECAALGNLCKPHHAAWAKRCIPAALPDGQEAPREEPICSECGFDMDGLWGGHHHAECSRRASPDGRDTGENSTLSATFTASVHEGRDTGGGMTPLYIPTEVEPWMEHAPLGVVTALNQLQHIADTWNMTEAMRRALQESAARGWEALRASLPAGGAEPDEWLTDDEMDVLDSLIDDGMTVILKDRANGRILQPTADSEISELNALRNKVRRLNAARPDREPRT